MNWRDYIESNQNVCHGTPCIKGTRIPVSNVLAEISLNLFAENVFINYPCLSTEHVKACLLFASETISFKKIYTETEF